jgi:hypothetical protein
MEVFISIKLIEPLHDPQMFYKVWFKIEVGLWIFQLFNALHLLLEMWVLVSMALNWFACLNKGSKLLSFSSFSLSYYGKSHKQPWSCKLYLYVIIYNDCEWWQNGVVKFRNTFQHPSSHLRASLENIVFLHLFSLCKVCIKQDHGR